MPIHFSLGPALVRSGAGILLALICTTAALAAPNNGSDGTYDKCMGPARNNFDNAANQCNSLPENGHTVSTSRSFCMQIATAVFLSDKEKCSGSAALETGGQTIHPSLGSRQALVLGSLSHHNFGASTLSTPPALGGVAAAGHFGSKLR